ncbi:unnamed protein product [Rotaria socialis]|uniref:Uncharacterized protein n=1 Tax=Rotaria socialis TaxID=392032 RepID=A0A820VIJ6_9BILA|nr:unnamed protein product [Rotaria socialis]CAF3539289.1 unnamed protein product [Rotaria socialis]CAF3581897.1 unnamed protein product [Rotaria socialis]CAF4184273.1 unnamed protein product [Rotaria socialis]CAF4502200.1 unnamed protein product [Rotaria socialis]
MEPFTPEILTSVVLIAIVLSGVTFVALTILIICLIRSKRGRVKAEIDDNDNDDDDDDDDDGDDDDDVSLPATSKDSSHTRSPSISPTLSSPSIRTPAGQTPMVQIPQKKKLPSAAPKHRSRVISVTDEYSSNDQMKHKHAYRHDASYDTIITNDSRLQSSQPQQKQQHAKLFKPVIEGNFVTRETPYPPDIIKREQFMIATRGNPNDKYV